MDIDLADPAFYQDPHAVYAGLRERGGLFRSARGPWVAIGFDEVSSLLKDARVSVGFPADPAWRARRPGAATADAARWMLLSDGERHRTLRRPAGRRLARSVVVERRHEVADVVDARLSALPDEGTVEFAGDVAEPIAAAAIRVLLGLPAGHDDRLSRWSAAILRMADPLAGSAVREAIAPAMADCRAFVEHCRDHDMLAPRRLASDLLADGASRDDGMANLVLLLAAAVDTVSGQLASALLHLLRHPDQLALVRDDPSIAEAGALELARYSSPVQIVTRRVAADIDTPAGTMRTGDKVMLLLGAANRDPRRYPDPDVLWLERPAVAPLGFGGGPHLCVGIHVGRLVVGEVLGRFVARYARIAVADAELRWRESVVAHQLEALHLHVSAR